MNMPVGVIVQFVSVSGILLARGARDAELDEDGGYNNASPGLARPPLRWEGFAAAGEGQALGTDRLDNLALGPTEDQPLPEILQTPILHSPSGGGR